jgi:hypothetical protein
VWGMLGPAERGYQEIQACPERAASIRSFRGQKRQGVLVWLPGQKGCASSSAYANSCYGRPQGWVSAGARCPVGCGLSLPHVTTRPMAAMASRQVRTGSASTSVLGGVPSCSTRKAQHGEGVGLS